MRLAYVIGAVAERAGGGVANLVTNAMNSRSGDALVAAYTDSIESLKDKLTVVIDGDGNTIRVKRIEYNADGRAEINEILGEHRRHQGRKERQRTSYGYSPFNISNDDVSIIQYLAGRHRWSDDFRPRRCTYSSRTAAGFPVRCCKHR